MSEKQSITININFYQPMTDFSIMVSPKLIRIQSNVKIGYIIGLYKLCSIYPQVRLEGHTQRRKD